VVLEPKGDPAEPQLCDETGAAPFANMPTAVLINKGSASASEVTTGALQDYGKARVFGEQSFGKGCGQSVINFSDGAQLALVTFLWKTPKGRHIHKIGITPDELVKGDDAEIKKGNDAQLNRAVEYLTTGH
jgi:carboxyl-terminal processing protease